METKIVKKCFLVFFLSDNMKRIKIKEALSLSPETRVTICGWVRSFRANRFIAVNDGSCLSSVQVVIDYEKLDQNIIDQITVGSSLTVSGVVVESRCRPLY